MAQARLSLGATLAAAAAEDAAEGDGRHRAHERRAWTVAALSLAVMAGELAGGGWLNSLALQSDGLHAGAHAGVLAIAAFAYRLARRRGASPAGSARILDGAAALSGILLALAGLELAVHAFERFAAPEPVRFAEAAAVTAVGLAVSAASALILRGTHERAHLGGTHDHAHGRDLNLWAAYLHMLADVTTSVLALAALVAGALTGWTWLDAAVGLLNAAVVLGFAVRLLRAAASALGRGGAGGGGRAA